jgi:hypothetical protein
MNFSIDITQCCVAHKNSYMCPVVLDIFHNINTSNELISNNINMNNNLRFLGKAYIKSGEISSRFKDLEEIQSQISFYIYNNSDFVKNNLKQGNGILKYCPKIKEINSDASLAATIFIEKEKFSFLRDLAILRITSTNVGITISLKVSGYTYETWHDIKENEYNEFISSNKRLIVNDFDIDICNIK